MPKNVNVNAEKKEVVIKNLNNDRFLPKNMSTSY